MAKMKKFLKYLIWLVLLYLIVNGLTYLATKDDYKELTNYTISTDSPKIEVTESMTAYTHGYIKGQVTNNTGEHIQKTYLKLDFYDKDGIYIGKEMKALEYFNSNETIKFDISYTYTNVGKIKLSISNEENTKKEDNKIDETVKPIITEETVKLAVPIAAVMLIWYILPY